MNAPTTILSRTLRLASCLAVAAALVPAALSGPATAQTRIFLPLAQLPEGGRTLAGDGIGFRVPSLDGLPVRESRLDLSFSPLDQVWGPGWGDAVRHRLVVDGTSRGQLDVSSQRFGYTLPLTGVRPGARVDVLPYDWNRLCREPDAPLDHNDPDASGLTVVLDDSRAPRLPAIESLLGPLARRSEGLTIWTAGGMRSDWHLAWGTALAEGWALRDRDRSAPVATARIPRRDASGFALLPGADLSAMKGRVHVLVGTADELAGIVSERVLAEVGGAFVTVMRLPGAELRAMIIVSGRNEREVLQAARAVGTPGRTWPDTAFEVLDAESPTRPAVQASSPEAPIWGPDRPSDPATRITFSELGVRTGSITPGSGRVYVPLIAADAGRPSSAEIAVDLDIAHAPGVGEDGGWTAHLNGQLIGSLALSSQSGERLTRRLNVPARDLRPGRNDLVLTPRLGDGRRDRCDKPRGVEATLFAGTSAVHAPWMGGARHHASLANWAAVGRLRPTAAPAAVEWRLVSQGDETASAALTLWARQAQQLGHALDGSRITWGRAALAPNSVVLGTHQDVSDMLAGVGIGEAARPFELPFPPPPEPQGWRKIAAELGLDSLAAMARDGVVGGKTADPKRALFATLVSRPDIGRSAVLMGWSEAPGASVVAMSAPTPHQLAAEAAEVVGPGAWQSLSGDLVLLDTASGSTRSEAVLSGNDQPPPAQASNVAAQMQNALSQLGRNAPIGAALVFLLGIGVLVLLIRASLNASRIRDAEDEEGM